ncbi:hypothetical protein L596_009889 [Steinernema carpocapsae]|uniref:Uncharacterized protein n=1 Tax=Steinernema carpocapsae TaxID=34508 RepID=A0A4U5PHZ5_STECR|nr:hypothetical protein L596_009889 [Steinernema carpocapsae]
MAVIDQYFVYVMILDYVLQLSALAYPIYIFKNDQDQFYVFIAIGIGATAFRSLFLCLAGCCGGKVHWTWYGLFMLLRIICSLCLIQTLSSLAFQKQNLDGFFVYDIEGIMVAFMWDILYLATLFFFQESN